MNKFFPLTFLHRAWVQWNTQPVRISKLNVRIAELNVWIDKLKVWILAGMDTHRLRNNKNSKWTHGVRWLNLSGCNINNGLWNYVRKFWNYVKRNWNYIHLGSSGAYPVSGVDPTTFYTIAVSPVVNQLWPAFWSGVLNDLKSESP